jgi:hypothetical protein
MYLGMWLAACINSVPGCLVITNKNREDERSHWYTLSETGTLELVQVPVFF